MGNVAILVVGFVLLVWGADKFVEGASELAKKLGIPSLIIGLTIVAFGTSAPELAVSLVAGLQGENEIAIGNVLGSNLFNLLVVIGCSAVVAPLVIEAELLNRDWIASIVGAILLGILLLSGNDLARVDAVMLLIGFVVIMTLQVRAALRVRSGEVKYDTGEYSAEKHKIKEDKIQELNSGKDIDHISGVRIVCYIALGLISIVIGGQLSVKGATELARIFHVSETIIGLTIVAIGTSLPELVTSIVATKRGENSIAIGNVIGSNIFNTFFILGISALCSPIKVEITAIYDTVLLVLVSIILYAVARQGWFNRKYYRVIGSGMIAVYMMYTAWILIR